MALIEIWLGLHVVIVEEIVVLHVLVLNLFILRGSNRFPMVECKRQLVKELRPLLLT